MTYTHEKILFFIGSALAAGASTIGAILSEKEERWMLVTMAASIAAASAMALVFKRADEGIRVVVGRWLISVICGVLASRFVVLHFGIAVVDGDVIALGAVAAGLTVLGYLVGFPLLETVNANGKPLADRIFGRWVKKVDPDK